MLTPASAKNTSADSTPATITPSLIPTSAVKPPPWDCMCEAKILAMETHPVCVACLGVQHAQAALVSPGSCEHRSRFTHESLHCRLSRQASLSVRNQLLTSAGAPTDSATPGMSWAKLLCLKNLTAICRLLILAHCWEMMKSSDVAPDILLRGRR